MSESSAKQIIANLIDPEESRIAILDNHGKLYDFFIERMFDIQRTGEIYKAKVDSVLPGIHAAFLNLGDGKNAFLYLADVKSTEVKVGMDMLVQIVKNPRKGKGARVSPRISLAGRYVVFIPNGHETGISKRIEDEAERDRLRRIVRKFKPENCGMIIRTAAVGVDDSAIESDIKELEDLWKNIRLAEDKSTAPSLIHRDLGLIERVLRDEVYDDISEIVVDTKEECDNVKAWIAQFMPEKDIDIHFYDNRTLIFDAYNIETQLAEAQKRKVWLSSGAFLVIDQTEALTVIDVNTGKYTGSKNLGDTVFKTNIEAACEIARQLRLRAVGGIVIIDFIDMANEEDNRRLIAEMQSRLRNDRYKARVFGVTELGLMEITRKRARSDLRAEMMRGCPHCAGLGLVEREENMAMHIKRFIRKICRNSDAEALLVECYPTIGRYIADTVLAAWEEEFSKKIVLRGCPYFSWGKYRLEMQDTADNVECRVKSLQKKEGWTSVYRTTSA